MISAEQFKAEVQALAAEIRVEAKEVHLREMKNKWGSCSTRGRLTFNTALLAEPASKRREIVVHELLHLRYPNHGKLFRAALRSYSQGRSEKTFSRTAARRPFFLASRWARSKSVRSSSRKPRRSLKKNRVF